MQASRPWRQALTGASLDREPGRGDLGSPCTLTVDAAGIRPDISWYTVCKGSLIGRLLANLGRYEERKLSRPV